jgi:hypothetical protein
MPTNSAAFEPDQIDAQGNLIPLRELPEADRRVITIAANSLGRPSLRHACIYKKRKGGVPKKGRSLGNA